MNPDSEKLLGATMSYTAVNLEPNDAPPCVLTFENLETDSNDGNMFKLTKVSGHASPRQVLAVMGESGSGKTTFLKALTGRMALKSGHINLNGEKIRRDHHINTIGYVQQQDIFFESLHLEQTLNYTALLRLSEKKFTITEKLAKVDELIEVLDLGRCRKTPVAGLSGGEKKRLSIACELITNPQILLIDEPTSGLDSFTAIKMINTLKEFATKQEKTVVITVHQPSSHMFQMFDSLLLLCDGKTAYFGPVSKVISFFDSLGYPIDPNYNPAEFVLETLKSEKTKIMPAIEKKAAEEPPVPSNNGRNNNNSPISDFSNHHVLQSTYKSTTSDSSSSRRSSTASRWPTSFSTQVQVLFQRNVRLAIPRIFSRMNLVQTLCFALMAGAIWWQTPRVEDSLSDIDGYLFFSAHYWMLFVLFQALWAFPPEKPVIQKEIQAGSYRLSAYYFSKMLAETPMELLLPLVYQTISFGMMGPTFASMFGLLGVQILSSLASQSAGLLFGVSFEYATATTVAAVFTVGAQLLGGFLTTNLPSYLKILSLVYNGLRNMQLVVLYAGTPIQCGNPSMFKSCPTAGKNVTTTEEERHFIDPTELYYRDGDNDDFPYWSHTVFLFCVLVVCRTLCYVMLHRSFKK